MAKWLLLAGMLAGLAWGGEVRVRDSSDPPFDPWQLKRELMQQQAWAEALRQQQALEWLQNLPLWCSRPRGGSNSDFECDGLFYRPYQHQGQTWYLRVEPPALAPPASRP